MHTIQKHSAKHIVSLSTHTTYMFILHPHAHVHMHIYVHVRVHVDTHAYISIGNAQRRVT